MQLRRHNYSYELLIQVSRWNQASKGIITNYAVIFTNYVDIITKYIEIITNFVLLTLVNSVSQKPYDHNYSIKAQNCNYVHRITGYVYIIIH